MENFIQNIANNPVTKLLVILLLLDVFLGSLRAIKEHKWNSTVGINGLLRKAGMLGSIVFLALADTVINLNILGFVPENISQAIRLQRIGLCEMFGLMFILYESTSILKNMALCELPINKKFNKKIQELLKKMTSELDGKTK